MDKYLSLCIGIIWCRVWNLAILRESHDNLDRTGPRAKTTMYRKAINCMLVTLIALQSVVAFADVHLYLQSDLEHLSSDQHEHQDHVIASQPAGSEGASSTEYDCNHCCHCHGSNSPFLSKVQSNSNFSNRSSCCPDYLFSTISFQDSPDNPPPIL